MNIKYCNILILIHLFVITAFAANISTDLNSQPKTISIDYDALLIVDVADGDDEDDEDDKNFMSAILEAIEDAINKQKPIILVDFNNSEFPTAEIIENRLRKLPKNYPLVKIYKSYYSAFQETHLKTCLNNRKIKKIFIIGTSTELCIKQTIDNGIYLGYQFVASSRFFDKGLPNIDATMKKAYPNSFISF